MIGADNATIDELKSDLQNIQLCLGRVGVETPAPGLAHDGDPGGPETLG